MSTPKDLDVADALENLVDQFADPLVFLRELVQNALDAGSPEVDVYTEFRPSDEDPDRGVMVIGVDDYGEGMDRDIIDHRLTRLFSSAKDQDFTKIGKFGIGFVSVFALRPDAVCVDTSRGGENWRILFKADRSFVRITREHPVDGTKIQVIKQSTRAEYEDVATRAGKTLRYWCKHVQGTVRFEDDDIHQPFGLPQALCSVTHEEEGIRVVVGYARRGASSFGFYNRGLTLLEGDSRSFLPGVAFKIDSKYLEHTLARDNIMRDANFDKAMEVVRRVAGEPLDTKLFETIESMLRKGAGGPALSAAHGVAASVIQRNGSPPEGPLLRTIDGKTVNASAVSRAAQAKRLWEVDVRSPLVDAAVAAEHLVMELPRGASGTRALIESLAGEPLRPLAHSFIRPVAPTKGELKRWGPLRSALGQLLEALGQSLAGVEMADFTYPHSCIPDRVFVLVPGLEQLIPWTTEALRPMERWKKKKDTLVVNATHELVKPLHDLVQREREFAAYTLLKQINLSAGPLPVELDSKLTTASTELRARRLEGIR